MTDLWERWRSLLLLAAGAEMIYLLVFVRRFPLLALYNRDADVGALTNYAQSGYLSYITGFAGLFVLFLLAYRQSASLANRGDLALVLVIGLGFGFTLVWMYPITAIDVLMYVGQSRILLHYHQNPIFVTPSHYPHDPILALADGLSTFGAPYGPLGIVLDALPSLLVRGDLLASLIALKLVFTALVAAAAFVTYRIVELLSPGRGVQSALFVAWNPLVLFEISGNGHNDIAMLLLVLLAVLLLFQGDALSATVAVAASALIKYATVILLPLWVLFCLSSLPDVRERRRYVAAGVLLVLILVAVAYFPFWGGFRTFYEALAEDQRRTDSLASLLPTVLPTVFSPAAATELSRALFVPVYLYAAFRSSLGREDLIWGGLIAIAGFVALAANNVEPWYTIWPVVMAGALPSHVARLAVVCMGFGAQLYAALFGFVWVWAGLDDRLSFTWVNGASVLASFATSALLIGLALAATQRARAPTAAAAET